MTVQIRLLGQLEVDGPFGEVTPRRPKLRQLLALLAANVNGLVRIEHIDAELWSDAAEPRSAAVLHTYVSQVRKVLSDSSADGAELSIRHARRVGYTLVADPDTVDARAFLNLVERARGELRLERLDSAAELFGSALSLWHGPALDDVELGPVLAEHVARLNEVRAGAADQYAQAQLALGRPQEVIDRLSRLVPQFPTHEGLQARYILALHLAGRRSDALSTYHRSRQLVLDQTGLEPGPLMQNLYQRLLQGDGEVQTPPGGVLRPAARLVPTAAALAQAPAEVPRLIGMDREMHTAVRVLSGEVPGVPPVLAVVGPPGSGKSALSARVTHTLRERFPDGHLHADLDAQPPAKVLARFIRAVAGRRLPMPETVEERSLLFRRVSTGLRLLVVLDNVGGSRDLELLLPGADGCATMAVCRTRLHSRRVGATIETRPLGWEDSFRLLARAVGERRLRQEPQATERLLDACAGLPLALVAIGTRLALRPHWSLERMADRIVGRVPEVVAEDADGAASIGRISRGLAERDVRTVLRVAPGRSATVSVRTAAQRLGWSEEATEDFLERMVESRLADVVPLPGLAQRVDHRFEYRFHPLLAHAARVAATPRRPPVQGGLADIGPAAV